MQAWVLHNFKDFSFLLKTQTTTLQQLTDGKTLNLILRKNAITFSGNIYFFKKIEFQFWKEDCKAYANSTALKCGSFS